MRNYRKLCVFNTRKESLHFILKINDKKSSYSKIVKILMVTK